MSQKTRILGHLKRHKTITPMQALSNYGCYRLAARIAELRESGVKIITTSKPGELATYRLIA